MKRLIFLLIMVTSCRGLQNHEIKEEDLVLTLIKNQKADCHLIGYPDKIMLSSNRLEIYNLKGDWISSREVTGLNMDSCISFSAYSPGADIGRFYQARPDSLDNVRLYILPFGWDCDSAVRDFFPYCIYKVIY